MDRLPICCNSWGSRYAPRPSGVGPANKNSRATPVHCSQVKRASQEELIFAPMPWVWPTWPSNWSLPTVQSFFATQTPPEVRPETSGMSSGAHSRWGLRKLIITTGSVFYPAQSLRPGCSVECKNSPIRTVQSWKTSQATMPARRLSSGCWRRQPENVESERPQLSYPNGFAKIRNLRQRSICRAGRRHANELRKC